MLIIDLLKIIQNTHPFNCRKSVGRGLEYVGKVFIFYFYVRFLCQLMLRYPEFGHFVEKEPYVLDKFRRPYLAKNISLGQKKQLIHAYYQWLLQPSHIVLFQQIYLNPKGLILIDQVMNSGCLTVTACYDHWCDKEGEIMLNLSLNQQKIFSITLMIDVTNVKPVIWIGGLQGRTGLDQIRQMTKQCYGLRPAVILLQVVQLMAKALGCSRVYAVAESNHIYQSNKYKKHRKLLRDYNLLWEECNGINLNNGWYNMTEMQFYRDIATVASKKRNMYRQRNQFLDNLTRQFNSKWNCYMPLVTSGITKDNLIVENFQMSTQ